MCNIVSIDDVRGQYVCDMKAKICWHIIIINQMLSLPTFHMFCSGKAFGWARPIKKCYIWKVIKKRKMYQWNKKSIVILCIFKNSKLLYRTFSWSLLVRFPCAANLNHNNSFWYSLLFYFYCSASYQNNIFKRFLKLTSNTSNQLFVILRFCLYSVYH